MPGQIVAPCPAISAGTPQILSDHWCKRQDLEWLLTLDQCCRGWNAISDPELVNELMADKLLESLLGEHPMRHEAGDLGSSLVFQRLRTLQQRSPALYEIVDNDAMLPHGLALLDEHSSGITIPHLVADDEWETFKLVLEALVGTIVWKSYGNLLARCFSAELFKLFPEQPDSRFQLNQSLASKVELLLQGVYVIHHHGRRTSWPWRTC
mmetsp:Transcript_103909/g.189267  ORF Transcript_103909/g.189267 Transcript_103909/m.189267 type:complete len:209 (+) Transcript_103909:5-631(+)